MSFLEIIEAYKNDLQNYTLEQLQYKSEEGKWSVGTMYNHLIDVALEYLQHVETCAAASVEQSLGKTDAGEQLYELGGFPPIKIKLPDALDTPSNPGSKEQLADGIVHIMQKVAEWAGKVDAINPNYKVKHDGFGWLNAREWYELIGMHFRHHLRQKAELDQKLKPRLTHVDSIYLAVSNREKSMEWFKKHFGLIQDDTNRLKIGKDEVFFLETLDGSSTNIRTKDWIMGEDHFLMPAFCFRAENIRILYHDLNSNGVHTEELQDHGWFLEFDFYDIDNNKFKVWEPIN